MRDVIKSLTVIEGAATLIHYVVVSITCTPTD